MDAKKHPKKWNPLFIASIEDAHKFFALRPPYPNRQRTGSIFSQLYYGKTGFTTAAAGVGFCCGAASALSTSPKEQNGSMRN